MHLHDGCQHPHGNGQHFTLRKALSAYDVGIAHSAGDLRRRIAVEGGKGIGLVREAREDDHDDAAERYGEGEEVVEEGARWR